MCILYREEIESSESSEGSSDEESDGDTGEEESSGDSGDIPEDIQQRIDEMRERSSQR